MESALLCASSRLVSSPCYERAGTFLRAYPSSFSGELLRKNVPTPRINGAAPTRRALISCVLGMKLKKQTIIPDPDYRIPIVLFGIAGGCLYVDNLAAGVPIGLLGLLLLVQTTRVRFVFDKEALEVKVGDQLQESGENVFVGGKNRWK
ncbi:peptidyl-tRNA hydrolase family protein [Striga asiatica]|uniref:Peptidyl-tRNA hydrolase family protein n=1 Tax=Striga asiatica TaxID=4170 RepID=A0A5A7R7T3_STRAF|nr:peptidyl-tRNA hydrolase family protein [Striga asiatica]